MGVSSQRQRVGVGLGPASAVGAAGQHHHCRVLLVGRGHPVGIMATATAMITDDAAANEGDDDARQERSVGGDVHCGAFCMTADATRAVKEFAANGSNQLP